MASKQRVSRRHIFPMQSSHALVFSRQLLPIMLAHLVLQIDLPNSRGMAPVPRAESDIFALWNVSYVT
jgi:hypothetical protein